ncbi:phosphonate ABC transporter, permease protein PhnE [uncultured Oxalicibacterium sp.]|uniref:phosphonate ABC transporter, permease protein PhnE n=1 Tax=uncultured Oxalicibacterium sp. TaxID=1168540 RepID=UPI0025E44957|nr:phosphonate ABC transporter, permease protein PhnE [uncultured Oxalicibacterium sp.]
MPALPDSLELPEPPSMRWSTIGLLLAIVLLIIASFVSLQLKWQAFFTAGAIQTTVEFLRGFVPPETAAPFLSRIVSATMETLAMSAVGTVLAAIAGLLLSLPASGRFGLPMRTATRGVLNVLRSIPELVWAAILLIAAGLGPFAGTLALAIHTAGVLGRLFADTLENCPPLSEETLRLNGVRPVTAFFYATLPHCSPQMMSYVLYRWENNIRAAAILGVVGAGGLGQMLKYHLSLFQMHQAATVIIAMLVLVCIVDAASFWLRRKMTR